MTTLTSFSEISLNPLLARAITDMGFEKPSVIQAQALPILLGEPTDFMGLAATGTGKTAAFLIPLLEKIDHEQRGVQALIMCPTRELALQITRNIDSLGKYLRVRSVSIYGGSSYSDQIRGLKDGAQIVVGTPGRIVDHIERGTLKLKDVRTLILDEADEMISMGFKEDMEKILSSISNDDSKTWLFSATMSPGVRHVANDYLTSPKQVQVNNKEVVPSTVEQLYYWTREVNKPEIICKLIDAAEDFYGLIFCQTKILVTELTTYLSNNGYRVDCLHGDKSQKERERTLQSFRDRRLKILVCTDVASRGIDVKDITHVVNYSLPRELENYVHRIGRTARSGKTGVAMSLVTPSQERLIGQIERITRSQMKEGRIPSRKDIATKKVSAFLTKFQAPVQMDRVVPLMDQSWQDALQNMTSQEVAAKFLAILMPEVFAVDFNRPEMPKPAEMQERSRRQSDGHQDKGGLRKGKRKFRMDQGSHRSGERRGERRGEPRSTEFGSERREHSGGERRERGTGEYSERRSERRSEYGNERGGSSSGGVRRSRHRDRRHH